MGPVHLALACLLDQPDDPWFVVSDEQTSARTDATSTGCVSMSKPSLADKINLLEKTLSFTQLLGSHL